MLRRIRAMIATMLRRPAFDRAMDDEFALHIDLLAADLVRRGIPPEDAQRQARLAFGNMTGAKEKARAVKGLAWLDTLNQDIRFTLRTLRKNAGFTAVAVLSLGFGIGAATTMFSVIDTLDFRALPYAGGDRLVSLEEVAPRDDRMCPGCGSPPAVATARDWLGQVHSYDDAIVTMQTSFTWEHDDAEESPSAGMATPGLLAFFGLRPIAGRDLVAMDTLSGAPPVVILTYEFWQARFGGDPKVVGTQLRARMGDFTAPPRAVTIVGVAPKGFRVLPYMKVWGAMALGGATARRARDVTVIARMKPDVAIAGASAELQAVSARLAQTYPAEYRGWGARVEPLRDRLGWTAGRSRGVLFGVTVAVLLIAVLNVAGLLFSRAAARQPEFAMRAALGAGQLRLFRQLLVEGSCIALLGGLIGVAFAFGGVHVAARWFAMPDSGLTLTVDPRMLAFAAVVSLIVGVTAAVAPAARAARTDASHGLRPRVTAGSRASRTSNLLITAQIALALMLLTVAGLLSGDFLQLRYLDLGYDPHGVYATQLSGSRDQWSNPGPWKEIVAETRARAAALRGVESASLEYENASHPSDVHPDRVEFDSRTAVREPRVRAVDPDYFTTWRNPVLIGRAFSAADRAGAPPVTIVNRAGASAFWPGQNPLGRRVFVGDGPAGEWLTVVGVTEDVETGNYSQRHSPVVYRPFDQARLYHASVGLSLRLAGDRADVLSSAQSMIREVTGRRSDPFQNEEDRLGMRYVTRRFNAIALDVFAGFGLLLAAMGIYGSIAFAVTRRTREIGVRVALGAARMNVLVLIARRGVVVATAGVAIGVAGSLALTRVFNSLVTVTSVTNPWIFSTSVVVVLAVTLLATFLPARRTMRVNPVIALRAE